MSGWSAPSPYEEAGDGQGDGAGSAAPGSGGFPGRTGPPGPRQDPRDAGRPWYHGPTVIVRPNRFLGVIAFAFVAVLAVVVLTQEALRGLAWVFAAVGVAAALLGVETFYAQVRVDAFGVTGRSLRGRKAYASVELDTPTLYRYVRHSRSGRQEVVRLAIRRAGGRYGFQLTSDLWGRAGVERVAHVVSAQEPPVSRPADFEAFAPGSTLPHQRQPVVTTLLGVVVALVLVAALGAWIAWQVPTP